jgi:uncharacterized protein
MANAKTKTADKGAAAGEDQSMEEILQSIRKIIAEEGDEQPAADVVEEAQDDEVDLPDSDVLELTDAIQDDGSVVNVNEGGGVLGEIDDALKAEDDFGEEAASEPEPAPAPKPAPKPRGAAADDNEGLVSSISIAASAEAMRALKGGRDLGSLPFVSGETVEGLVQQLLRPMLKEWLDANLPAIVQHEVQREVQRISARVEQDN